MSLRHKLNDSMKEAMKAKDAKRLATLRLVLAALKDSDIAARTETSRDLLGDDEILCLLAKMIKQREESATAYDAGKRPELAAGEREEIAIIRSFMPAQMDEAGVKQAAQSVIAELGASFDQGYGQGDGGDEGTLCRPDGFRPRLGHRQRQSFGAQIAKSDAVKSGF